MPPSRPLLLRCLTAVLLLPAALGARAGGEEAVASAEAAARGPMAQLLRTDAERHEMGDGVPRDAGFAAALYCRAAKLGDAESQYRLAWLYMQGRGGVPRNDAWAAHLLQTAADAGIPQARESLRLLGGAAPEVPDCLRPPPPPAVFASVSGAGTTSPELFTAAPRKLVDLVTRLAPEYRVKPELALAIMRAESNFNPQAVSPKNAQGLMQLIPATAERFNVRNAFDPVQNLRGGLAYLRWLLAYFQGDVKLVAAAYNAGEGTVDKYLGVPPFEETRGYVQRVLSAVGLTDHPYDPGVTQPSPRLERIRAPHTGQRAAR